MLLSRFIASQPLSILPLYLGNFSGLRTLPLIEIPLPPTSSVDKISKIPPPSNSRSSRESLLPAERPVNTKPLNKHLIERWAPIALARSVQIIVQCKRAIWEKFLELNNPNPNAPPSKQLEQTVREEFDHLFQSWLK